jgi:TetR/AcrR family transcriptional regulator of autoinduction and epiphytic fitness
MNTQANKRAQQTHERLRETAQRLFLQQGYQSTSVDAILAEAGISSRETFYRHYVGKEELFVDVLSHLTMEQPGFSEKLAALPRVHDLSTLRQAFTELARELLFLMNQPEYQALMRITIAEAPRFPQLGPLFFAAIPQHALSLIMALLQEAKEQQIITDVDFEAMARVLLGGLLTYAIQSLMLVEEEAQPPLLDRADALVEVMMRALAWGRDEPSQ